jgi:hypothetical protein
VSKGTANLLENSIDFSRQRPFSSENHQSLANLRDFLKNLFAEVIGDKSDKSASKSGNRSFSNECGKLSGILDKIESEKVESFRNQVLERLGNGHNLQLVR